MPLGHPEPPIRPTEKLEEETKQSNDEDNG